MKKLISFICTFVSLCMALTMIVGASSVQPSNEDDSSWNWIYKPVSPEKIEKITSDWWGHKIKGFTFGVPQIDGINDVNGFHVSSDEDHFFPVEKFSDFNEVGFWIAKKPNQRFCDLDTDLEARSDCRGYAWADHYRVATRRRINNPGLPPIYFRDTFTIVLIGDFTYIGNESFCFHTRLKDIYIPDSVTEFGKNVFNEQTNPVIHCTNGSAAMKYALENNHAFDADGYEGITGDLDCDDSINMNDVLTLRKYIAGIRTKVNINASDVNGDGAVNMKDVLKLRKLIAGIE